MGADYYPRLTGVAHDHAAVNRLVNEQTEIGLLLAVPGLLATLALAPWIIRLFYTSEFLPAVELL
jgi:PST family polysaccharide transporter